MGMPLTPHQQPSPASMEPSDCHILVVDDERISQVVVSSLLRKHKYKVIQVVVRE